MVSMATYLEIKIADYTATELNITPHSTLIEAGDKAQVQHGFDNGAIEIVTMSGSFFKVTLQWDFLSTSDASDFLEFWYGLIECRAKTFYWVHPVDGNTYVARFIELPVFIDKTDNPNGRSIASVTINIEGVKA